MIQHLRNVNNLRSARALNDAQRKVVVLRALKAFAKTTHLVQRRFSVAAQVADHVLRPHQLWVVVGFKVRPKPSALLIHLVFIAEHNVGIGLLLQAFHQLVKCQWVQQIVVIQKRYPLALGNRQCAVAAFRNMAILRSKHHRNSAVFGGRFFQKRLHLFVARGIVGNAQLPVRVDLSLHTFNGLRQKVQRRVVGRHDDGHQGLGVPSQSAYFQACIA